MAGIDKTYTSSFDEYMEFKNWAIGKSITFFNGKKENVSDWIWDLDKDDFDGRELPIMNTPTWLDIYLIQNCPIKFVSDRMKEVYGKSYNKLKKEGFCGELPDDYKQNRKIIIKNTYRTRMPINNKAFMGRTWLVQSDDFRWGYNDEWECWVDRDLNIPSNTNTMHVKTIKSLVRKMRKMFLPSGIEFSIIGRLDGQCYKMVIK